MWIFKQPLNGEGCWMELFKWSWKRLLLSQNNHLKFTSILFFSKETHPVFFQLPGSTTNNRAAFGAFPKHVVFRCLELIALLEVIVSQWHCGMLSWIEEIWIPSLVFDPENSGMVGRAPQGSRSTKSQIWGWWSCLSHSKMQEFEQFLFCGVIEKTHQAPC